jgi:transcriptional regulator with XRE-family HTH domain
MLYTDGMSNTHTTRIIVQEVGALMGRYRITQAELADAIGMSAQAMSQRMQGRIAFRIDELDEIAAYFDVPITSLVESSDHAQTDRSGPRRSSRGGFRTGRGFTGDEAMLVGAGIVTL